MLTKKLFPAFAILILLASCSPAATALPTATPSQTAEPTSTFTPNPTETPTATPTETPIAVESLSGQLLFDMYHTGKVEYSELSDAQRKELAILNDNEVRQNTPTEAFATGRWEAGSIEFGLTRSLTWARTDKTPASDFENATENIAEISNACFFNNAGDFVLIGPNNEEYVVPRFNVDGPLAGKTVTELAAMSFEERMELALESIRQVALAQGISEERTNIVLNAIKQNKLDFWPTFINPFYPKNKLFAHIIDPNTTSQKQFPTNVVTTVIVDDKGTPITCINIHQIGSLRQTVYDMTAGQTPNFDVVSGLLPQDVWGRTGETVSLMSFNSANHPTQGGFLFRGGNGISPLEQTRILGGARTIEAVKAFLSKYGLIFEEAEHVIGDAGR